MKKFLLLLAACFSINAFAQNNITSIHKVNFYGVDFSHANLYGLEESPDAIKLGLERINQLFIKEKKKYDIGRYFKKEVVNYCFESTDRNNGQISVEKQYSYDRYFELSTNQVQKIINNLSCKSDGYGLVFIAESLNKVDETASYLVVFFDGKTKKIIYSKRASGKAKGFGVRNHWAGSIYDLLKSWKY